MSQVFFDPQSGGFCCADCNWPMEFNGDHGFKTRYMVCSNPDCDQAGKIKTLPTFEATDMT